jgi:hypothetical protein
MNSPLPDEKTRIKAFLDAKPLKDFDNFLIVVTGMVAHLGTGKILDQNEMRKSLLDLSKGKQVASSSTETFE